MQKAKKDYEIAREDLLAFLKREEIFNKQLEREHVAISKWIFKELSPSIGTPGKKRRRSWKMLNFNPLMMNQWIVIIR